MAPGKQLEQLHRELTERVDALRDGAQWRRMLEVASRLHSYSLANILLIDAQWTARYRHGEVAKPTPGPVAGYRTWQALGRQVIRGQKGLAVIAPTGSRERFVRQADDSIRQLAKGEHPAPGEELIDGRPTVRGFTVEHVFAVSQTDGTPLPQVPRPQPLTGDAPAGLVEALTRYAQHRGFTLRHATNAGELGGADGRTNFATSTITLRADMEPAAVATTLAHELGHVLLHDPTRDGASVVHRGVGEVEAESVAYIVSAAHGLDTSADSLPYVAGWLGTTATTETMRGTASRVVGAAHQLLAGLDTVQFGDGHPPGLDPKGPQHRVRDLDQLAEPDLSMGAGR